MMALGVVLPIRLIVIPALVGLAHIACGSMPRQAPPARYIVTATPIEVGVGPGICVAVDPTNPQGAWWWEPGRTGCASRSTGPGVFYAQDAKVAASPQSGLIEVRFRVDLITGPGSTGAAFKDIRLLLEKGSMQAMPSGARVSTERRNDLEVPERPPGR